MKIYRIVLTGGPCAGKTTHLNHIKKYLNENKILCLIVPEAATLLIDKGFDPEVWDTYLFQESILTRQLFDEEENTKFINKAKIDGNMDKLVIIYDRAIYDNKAYFSNLDDFKKLLKNFGLNSMEVLDGYGLVLDLLSMATCKPEAYTTINNNARKESLDFAKGLDKKTSNAWANHRNMRIISGACSEEEETKSILRYIYDFINDNTVVDTHKFLVDDEKTDFSRFYEMEPLTINDTYIMLRDDGCIYKLSERIGDDRSYLLDTYIYKDGKKVMLDSTVISSNEYHRLYNNYKHLGYESKKQYSFVDNEILYRLCYYRDRTVLEVQKNDFNDIKIPNYIKVIKEIEDKDFGFNTGYTKKLHI